MLLRFVYQTADITAISYSLDSTEIYIRCSVHKYEWHSILSYNFDSFKEPLGEYFHSFVIFSQKMYTDVKL